MGGTLGWLSTLWSLGVTDKDGEDVRKLREQRLGDRVIKRVNKCIANAFLGFLAQCALVLCAISLLPDKKRISYFVFILLLLLEFKRRFGIEKLGLQKLKMDYELGKIDYFLDNSSDLIIS